MRFMMIMIPKAYEDAAADARPSAEAVAEMMKYNVDMQKSGVMLSGDGLHPPVTGARVAFGGGKPRVIDGPYIEAKEMIGGFWLIDVRSKEEAVEWARRCPAEDGDIIEIRRVFETEDFPPDVQAAARGIIG